ncbi:MAG: VWA domain-containing protein [Solirubrobacterales bacterium]|nr:VWA domain-containing protein [Solirubrobacterales bacterium]
MSAPLAISLAAPHFLLLLCLIPLGACLQVMARRRRRRHAVRLPATPTLAALARRQPRWRRWLPATLLGLAVAALALALARPERTVAVPVERASVVLVIDTSRSMQATDVDPDRIEAAKRAALSFLDKVPKELRVGLVAYNDAVHTILRPTEDRDGVRLTIEALEATGGTATGDALAGALQSLRERVGDRGGRRPPAAVVLLSDGKTTDGQDPVEVARQFGRLRIPISTVALGTPDGVLPGPYGGAGGFPVPPDPVTLRRIARASGGEAFEVDEQQELKRIYERLGSRLGTKPKREEVTAGVAGAGLAFLLAGVLLTLRWRGRVA